MEPTFEVPSAVFPLSDLPPAPHGEADWEGLVRQYQGVVRSRVWRLLEVLGQQPDREKVEEILQDVYCRLFEDALRRWRGRTLPELIAYVGTVADRTVLDHFRRAQALQRSGIQEVQLGRRIETIPDPRDPELDFLHAESQTVLLRCCRDGAHGGPGRRRRNVWVARLALLEGWTNQEIACAARGRLNPNLVASLIHRLRRRLERQGFTRSSGSRRRPRPQSRRHGAPGGA